MELGINFIDSADCYLGGNSERYIGKALRDRRDGVFVMTKVDQRDREGSRQALETSLRNLQMETIDLWQFHAVPSIADVERIFGPGGAMETAAAAKKEGKIRYIGITGHTLPEALAHAVSKYHDVLDTVQMPINPLDASYSSFQKEVLPLINQYQLGALAMKTAAKGTLFKQKIATPRECLRYAWSQPVSIVISGMETIAILEENIRTALSFEPMSDEEQARLVSRVSQYAGTDIEDYKQKRRA